jgi:hypothetical protein
MGLRCVPVVVPISWVVLSEPKVSPIPASTAPVLPWVIGLMLYLVVWGPGDV